MAVNGQHACDPSASSYAEGLLSSVTLCEGIAFKKGTGFRFGHKSVGPIVGLVPFSDEEERPGLPLSTV